MSSKQNQVVPAALKVFRKNKTECSYVPQKFWSTWGEERPCKGSKVVVLLSDGATSFPCYCNSGGELLIGEDGTKLTEADLHKSVWSYIPDNYGLWFMEQVWDETER